VGEPTPLVPGPVAARNAVRRGLGPARAADPIGKACVGRQGVRRAPQPDFGRSTVAVRAVPAAPRPGSARRCAGTTWTRIRRRCG